MSLGSRRDAGDCDVEESIGRTELDIVQAGVPDAIPLEACYLGWQESLRNLARLVEPEINHSASGSRPTGSDRGVKPRHEPSTSEIPAM